MAEIMTPIVEETDRQIAATMPTTEVGDEMVVATEIVTGHATGRVRRIDAGNGVGMETGSTAPGGMTLEIGLKAALRPTSTTLGPPTMAAHVVRANLMLSRRERRKRFVSAPCWITPLTFCSLGTPLTRFGSGSQLSLHRPNLSRRLRRKPNDFANSKP